MKTFLELLAHTEIMSEVKGLERVEVFSITADSRKVNAGTVFVAVKGLSLDGHDYIQEVIKKGCAGVVVEQEWLNENKKVINTPLVAVKDTRGALGHMASLLYENPAESMTLIGVTGTNGKTTTTYIIESIIQSAGGKPGVIGTINYRFDGNELPAPHTTPEPVSLQETLREMADCGVTHVIMEVSSHALLQKRLSGLKFDVALFTNLSRDHLDYHGTMESYFEAKKQLFTHYLSDEGHALVIDGGAHSTSQSSQGWGCRLATELRMLTKDRGKSVTGSVQTCGLAADSDVVLEIRKIGVSGLSGKITGKNTPCSLAFRSALVGEFNAKNIVGAGAVAIVLNIAAEAIESGINRASKIPGRMEKICEPGALNSDCQFSVFVDYAHTPDAMENVLRTLGNLEHEKIIIVFGCGGDRDHGKRFVMGEIAGKLADMVIVTSDNSRTEDDNEIMNEICRGLEAAGKVQMAYEKKGPRGDGYIAVCNRSEAISIAIRCAKQNDIVLVSGKGHENYQITKEGNVFFDDRQEVRKNLATIN